MTTTLEPLLVQQSCIDEPQQEGLYTIPQEDAGEDVREAEEMGEAADLPAPEGDVRPFIYGNGRVERLTHYSFRYPAKFHPPVVRSLLTDFSRPGQRVLDPFCGSGSLLVEAAVAGRDSVGMDVDPVAVFVSRQKTRRFNLPYLQSSVAQIRKELLSLRRTSAEYEMRQFEDISHEDFASACNTGQLWLPAIPNLSHWFRRYVSVELAQIHQRIVSFDGPQTHKGFMLLCFGSIIRAASNADPVPVSGLEVTAHMKRKEMQGRVVNTFALFDKSLAENLVAVSAFQDRADPATRTTVLHGDVLRLGTHLKMPIDVIITSPPYHNAVDYYRRHQLELFWLQLAEHQAERVALKTRYIGRSVVSHRDPLVEHETLLTPVAAEWERQIRGVSPKRADAFKHYIVSMRKAMLQMARVLPEKGLAVQVVGHSTWNGMELPTAVLLSELVTKHFCLAEHYRYQVKNRYMSYSRHNGADISEEHVLVFRRTPEPAR